MPREFFPDPIFGWAYCAGLGVLTCVAAYTDTRTAKIPNRLNLTILAIGFLANVTRSAWMGAIDKPLWAFDTGSVWLGLIDGVLFAVLGFVVAFAVMTAFWIFGLCGGGDVKLLSAVAVWIGLSQNLLFIWLASIVVLFFWTTARVLTRGVSPKKLNRTLGSMKKQGGDTTPNPRSPVRVTYSLPIAIATIVVLLWVYRFELLLAVPKSTT